MKIYLNFKKIFSVLLLAIALVTSVVFVSGCSNKTSTTQNSTEVTYKSKSRRKRLFIKTFFRFIKNE